MCIRYTDDYIKNFSCFSNLHRSSLFTIQTFHMLKMSAKKTLKSKIRFDKTLWYDKKTLRRKFYYFGFVCHQISKTFFDLESHILLCQMKNLSYPRFLISLILLNLCNTFFEWNDLRVLHMGILTLSTRNFRKGIETILL